MDIAHKETDRILTNIERRVRKEYRQASKEVEQKLDNYFAAFRRKDEAKREAVKAGEMTEHDYKQWRTSQLAVGKRWESLKDQLAQDYTNTTVIARNISDGYMPEVYAINHNFATYEVETSAKVDTSYTLYSAESVERLIRENPDILPQVGRTTQELIDSGVLKKWEMKNIQSTMIQGILQGESINHLAQRMARDVGATNYKDCVKHARTMTTATQNAGRVDGFKRAEKMGIDMEQEWVAVLDGRTRHEHRQLDGQRRPVGEPFEVDGYKLRYPADPEAPYYLIMNCRCTLIGQLKGFERDTKEYRQDPDLDGMTYDEWKQNKTPKKAKTTTAKQFAKAKTTSEANAQAKTLLEQAYESHRTRNGTQSVPLADLGDSSTGVINANYANISTETASAFNETLAGLIDEYDTPLTKVRSMTKQEVFGRESVFASVYHDYTTDTATMTINPIKCKDFEKLKARVVELSDDGYMCKVAPEKAGEYIATHEFAHAILNIGEEISDKTNWVNANYETIRAARKEVEPIYNKYIKEIGGLEKAAKDLELQALTSSDADGMERFGKMAVAAYDKLNAVKISDYSLANADEFLAESFANERLGVQSNPYAAEVVKIIDKYFRR